MYGHEALARLEVGRATAGVEVACTAENELSALPVTSNHRTLGVKCKQTALLALEVWIMSSHYSHCHPPVGPGKVYIHGPAELEEGVTGSYSCYSDEANPPSDISVSVIGMVNIISDVSSFYFDFIFYNISPRPAREQRPDTAVSLAENEGLGRIFISGGF